VVLPDGRVWDGLRGLRKDNTGYDLKHLFIGAEGTLGIITAAVLKLYPKPHSLATAWIAVDSPAAAVALLGRLRDACGDRVTGYELMSRACLDLVFRHIPETHDPLTQPYAWYVLAELSDSAKDGAIDRLMQDALEDAAEAGLAHDAAVAASESQRAQLWGLREHIPEAQKLAAIGIKHDVSVPVSRVADLITQAGAALTERFPGIVITPFGHVGDGNIHYNCALPADVEAARADEVAGEIARTVYDVVHSLGGSISAEHGLGVLKREEIGHYKGAIELELMRRVKAALDPLGIMNPGKVL
jgi:FAD/FMN-containing dehydrogenase